MNLKIGEKITLNDKDTYIIMNTINYDNNNYVFLLNNDKEVVIKVGLEIIDGDEVFIKIVNDKELIKKLLEEISGEKISE